MHSEVQIMHEKYIYIKPLIKQILQSTHMLPNKRYVIIYLHYYQKQIKILERSNLN